jgi:hypothetical protein
MLSGVFVSRRLGSDLVIGRAAEQMAGLNIKGRMAGTVAQCHHPIYSGFLGSPNKGPFVGLVTTDRPC